MRHRNSGTILDRKKGPRELMIRNLVSSIILYEKVETSPAKAKVARSFLERLITRSKKNDVSSQRYVKKFLPVKEARAKLFEVLREKYQEIPGGYTRIVKMSHPRKGDGGELVRLELK